MRGYRKLVLGLILGLAYLACMTALCWKGLAGNADPTALGVMAGGIATGSVGIMSAFVWGNKPEPRENGAAK